jgi:ribose transport system ATP-binding protein
MSSDEPAAMTTPLIELSGITKSFAGNVVLQDIDIAIGHNEIVGLAGENGAGKSTMLKIMAGIYKPDRGRMKLRGEPYAPGRYTDAVRQGVSMVFQEQALIPNLYVYENVFLGHEEDFSVFGYALDKRRMAAEVRRHFDDLGLVGVDPWAVTGDYPFHTRQMIEIAKAFILGAFFGIAEPVVLLDEPTAAIGDKQVELLFKDVRRFADHASFVLVTHRLSEYLELCDRLYLLKDGRKVGEARSEGTREADLHRIMVGRIRDEEYYKQSRQTKPVDLSDAVLSARNLEGARLRNVSLDLVRGEILGVGGLIGSGKEDLVSAVVGSEPFADGGEVTVKNEKLPVSGRLKRCIALDVGYVPNERKLEGIIPFLSVATNITLVALDRCVVSGVVSPARERKLATEMIDKLRIRASGTRQLVNYLSGGNQQKIVIAKWLLQGVDILILHNPTRGVDVGVKEEIYALLRDLTAAGVSVLLISDDLPELIGLSSRIMIMRDGEITVERTAPPEGKPTEEELVRYML